VIATVPVGVNPYGGIAVTPDGKSVYVGNANSYDVSVIDTATNTVIQTIAGFPCAVGIAITQNSAPTPPRLDRQQTETSAKMAAG